MAKPNKPAPKLTKEQRAEIQSLIEDSGWTRKDATAWVLTFAKKEGA